VDVQAQSGTYATQTQYSIVQAPGGVTGQFSGVTSNLAFLSPLLTYDPGNVYLTLTRNDVPFTAVTTTANQSEAALAFMRIAQTGTSEDSALVLNTLVGLSSAQARAAFDSIAGTSRAAMSQTGVLNQRAINQNIVARLGVAEGGSAPATGITSSPLRVAFEEGPRNDSTPAYAQALPSPALQADRNDASKGFWVRGYGGSGRLDGDASAAGSDFRFGGVLAGFDHALRNGVTLGVFGGYAEPRSDQDGAVGSARTRNHQIGTYGRYRDGPWYLDGIASYARQDTDASRLVVVGPLVRTASGSFNGSAWAAHVETGYTLASGITPMAALSWLRQTQDAYDEQGAGALNLSVPGQRSESLRSMLGARAAHSFQATGVQWTIEGRAAWAHEFNDPVAASARLAGDPTAAIFSVTGPAVPRDSALIGAGISAELKRDLSFYADVSAELNGQQRTYALGAGLRYRW
jgi:outer membrane autotransporter protein